MQIEIEKHVEKKYVLTLTYQELNALYHCAGNYVEMMENLVQQHVGIRFTGNELKLQEYGKAVVKQMREEEPRLFADISFEFG